MEYKSNFTIDSEELLVFLKHYASNHAAIIPDVAKQELDKFISTIDELYHSAKHVDCLYYMWLKQLKLR